MARQATTFRIDEIAMQGLVMLGRLSGKSANQLANEAIKEFVAKRSMEVENELTDTLSQLKAYRTRDPDFGRSIADFVETEALSIDDPVEGKAVKKAEALQVRLRSLLNG